MPLFLIEGIDGSGKTTQIALLTKRLEEEGFSVRGVKFPNYADRSSAPVQMYLEGELGSDPDAINAYAVSAFYAVDRFISFKKSWEADYLAGKVILADRYTMSNLIHQASKLPQAQRPDFAEWLDDFEFGKMQIPRPDMIFYLDVPPEASMKQVENRYGGDESKKDIHERDADYLRRCYEAGLQACALTGAVIVPCFREGNMLPPEEINDFILKRIKEKLNG